jgi:hypothetical protein
MDSKGGYLNRQRDEAQAITAFLLISVRGEVPCDSSFGWGSLGQK